MHHVSELFWWDTLLRLIVGSGKWLSKNLTGCNISRGKFMVNYGEYECNRWEALDVTLLQIGRREELHGELCQDRNQRHVQIIRNPTKPKIQSSSKTRTMCLICVRLWCITDSSDKAVYSHHYWSVLCVHRAMEDISFLKVIEENYSWLCPL